MRVIVRLLIVWCGAAILAASAVVVLAQTPELDSACITARDAHRLTEQTFIARRSLQQLRGALATYESIPDCSSACRKLSELLIQAEADYPRAYRLPDGTADLCEGQEGSPPPEKCRWRFWPRHVWQRLRTLAERCEEQRACFVPQIPSTGRNETQLLPEEP